MFADTNYFVYARFPGAPQHEDARDGLRRALDGGEPLRISRQVIREYLAVVTRPQAWADALTLEEALEDVSRLIANFEILEDGPEVTETLIALCHEVPVGGWQIHDANIVATMLAHGERRLLTFNESDFRRYVPRIELVGTSARDAFDGLEGQLVFHEDPDAPTTDEWTEV